MNTIVVGYITEAAARALELITRTQPNALTSVEVRISFTQDALHKVLVQIPTTGE